MRDVLSDLLAVWRAGGTAGVGTVVRTFASAPRLAGAAMVVAPDGSVSGSVSGGCVEGALYELAAEVAGTVEDPGPRRTPNVRIHGDGPLAQLVAEELDRAA